MTYHALYPIRAVAITFVARDRTAQANPTGSYAMAIGDERKVEIVDSGTVKKPCGEFWYVITVPKAVKGVNVDQ